MLRTIPPETVQALTDADKRTFITAFMKGMADGRKKILSKLDPWIGKRSRTLKRSATMIRSETPNDNQDGWAELKRRAKKLRRAG
jgi:hypothetical protein